MKAMAVQEIGSELHTEIDSVLFAVFIDENFTEVYKSGVFQWKTKIPF
jgi:hypothetical protein